MSVRELFYSKNKDLTKSDHVCGSETKEITEDLGKRVDVAHQTRKAYKTISKSFGLHKSTVRLCTHDHCYLPEKWSTNKAHSKVECVIDSEVAKVPRVTSKQLKAFLTLANINVQEPTIRRTLNNHGVLAELQEESHCSPKGKLLAKDHVMSSDDYWRKV